MNWPWWVLLLVLAVEGWPVALGLGVVFLVSAVFTRGWVRWACLLACSPFAAAATVAAWWGIDAWQRDRESAALQARLHEVLDAERVVDGIALPKGTEIQWRDTDHAQIASASPPDPVVLWGLRVSWIARAGGEDSWDLLLPEPEPVEGWTCAPIGVRVSFRGQLRSCRLAAGRDWQGWPIPADTLLDLTAPDKVGLALPDGASMAAPEIGHSLTATGSFSLNADGSLDQFYFEDNDPLVVAGRRLWNTVQWSYDPATLGQGRRRRAVSVRGNLLGADGSAGEDVAVRLPDGHVTAVP